MKIGIIILLISLIFGGLCGCVRKNPISLVNEQSFALDEITDLRISYDEELITFYESENDLLVIKEYMNVDQSQYDAVIKQKNGVLHISEGRKPFFSGNFQREVEVYLPSVYDNSLTVTTTSGVMNGEALAIELSELNINTTSGVIQLGKVTADTIELSTTSGFIKGDSLEGEQINLTTTSGKIICEEISGMVNYSTTSGKIVIAHAYGAGNYQASSSGIMEIKYEEVTDNLDLYSKSEKILLTLPKTLSFYFEAETKEGAIEVPFEEYLERNGRKMTGQVGTQSDLTISVKTKEGDIIVQ